MRPLFFLILLLAATGVSPLCAQEDERKSDHDQLRALRHLFEQAAAANDLDRLRPYLAEHFSIVTFTDREFTDFEAFKARWTQTREEMLHGGTYTVDLNPELSQLFGDVAICRGNAHNRMTTGKGAVFEFDSRWTVVCQKQDGHWKIVRGHNSLDPFGNPMLVAGVRRVVLRVALSAALGGLLIGFGAGWWWRRRKQAV